MEEGGHGGVGDNEEGLGAAERVISVNPYRKFRKFRKSTRWWTKYYAFRWWSDISWLFDLQGAFHGVARQNHLQKTHRFSHAF